MRYDWDLPESTLRQKSLKRPTPAERDALQDALADWRASLRRKQHALVSEMLTGSLWLPDFEYAGRYRGNVERRWRGSLIYQLDARLEPHGWTIRRIQVGRRKEWILVDRKQVERAEKRAANAAAKRQQAA